MAIDGMPVLVLSPSESAVADIAAIVEAAGARPQTATTHYGAARLIATRTFDVVIAHGDSTSDDWFDVLISMRHDPSVPFIMLVSESRSVANCLALGADDCVVWPATPSELVARIAARVHPNIDGPNDPLEFDELLIDRATHEVHVGGERVHLTPKEYELLVYLASAPDRTFTKEQILRAVWHSTVAYQGLHTVAEHVYRLRRKLAEASGASSWITTVGRHGYRFADPAAID